MRWDEDRLLYLKLQYFIQSPICTPSQYHLPPSLFLLFNSLILSQNIQFNSVLSILPLSCSFFSFLLLSLPLFTCLSIHFLPGKCDVTDSWNNGDATIKCFTWKGDLTLLVQSSEQNKTMCAGTYRVPLCKVQIKQGQKDRRRL